MQTCKECKEELPLDRFTTQEVTNTNLATTTIYHRLTCKTCLNTARSAARQHKPRPLFSDSDIDKIKKHSYQYRRMSARAFYAEYELDMSLPTFHNRIKTGAIEKLLA